MTERGCCKPGFYGKYQPGKLDMSSDEFYDATERYEEVLSCCCSCTNPRRSKKVTVELNEEFKNRRIRFKVESRTDMVTNSQQDLKGVPNVRIEHRYFLVISQDSPIYTGINIALKVVG